jgi:hypothetical protein
MNPLACIFICTIVEKKKEEKRKKNREKAVYFLHTPRRGIV